MLGFCLLAPFGDALAKLLGGIVALSLLLLVRFTSQWMMLLPLMVIMRQPLKVRADLWLWTLVRTGLHIAGIALVVLSLRYLPLADALAIAFVMPFIMLILGHFVLGEEVGTHRAAACLVGFIGTLLVIQPNFVAVGAPALLPLGVAVVFAFFMLVTRKLAQDLSPIHLQMINGLQATCVLLPLFLVIHDAPFDLVAALDQRTLSLLLLMGVVGTGAHLLMTWSLRFAPSATVAPMQYLEIPVATIFGWLIFAELPNGLAALGICITMAAGLYIILREQRLAAGRKDGHAAR